MSFHIGICKINISFYFFAVICICSLSDRSGVMASGLLSAIVHEAGHIISVKLFGLSITSLSLNSSGFKMYVPGLDMRRNVCIVTSLSGAAANLLLFFTTVGWAENIAVSSLVLCILSLLPCDPFDGGVALRSILEKFTDEEKADNILFIITLLILLPLTCIGTYILIVSRYNFSLLTLSMLIFTTICQRTLK